MDHTAVALKVAVEILKRPATKGLAWVYTSLTGKTVLILGPARAGKTSFSDYLRLGLMEPEQPTEKTVETHRTSAFRVQIGRDQSLELHVKSAVDEPGQLGPMEHAKLAELRKPHAIVVILDLSAPFTGQSDRATAKWLTEFCKHLAERIQNNTAFRRKLKGLIFVANKSDTQDDATVQKRISDVRRIVTKNLNGVYATTVDAIPIMPCILVQHEDAQRLADAVIIRLAKLLSE
ncbi:MAG: hypothetical protein J0L64_25610 [Acidobacteria bacterium]|nr:hypothetical protein [Acidobacteriota bacterium]